MWCVGWTFWAVEDDGWFDALMMLDRDPPDPEAEPGR